MIFFYITKFDYDYVIMDCICEPMNARVRIGDIINELLPITPCKHIGLIIEELVDTYLESRKDLITGITIIHSIGAYEIPTDRYWSTRFNELTDGDDVLDIIIYLGEGTDFGKQLDDWLMAYRMMLLEEEEPAPEAAYNNDLDHEPEPDDLPNLEDNPEFDMVVGIVNPLVMLGMLARAGVADELYERLADLENVATPLTDKTLLQKIPHGKGDCAICLDPLKGECYQTPCNHYYCIACLDKWLESSKTCPTCRHELDVPHKV